MISKIVFFENTEHFHDDSEIYVFGNSQRCHHQIFSVKEKSSRVRKIISQQKCQAVLQLLNI